MSGISWFRLLHSGVGSPPLPPTHRTGAPKSFGAQLGGSGTIGVVGHFPAYDLLEQFGHLDLLGLVAIEAVPGPVEQFLQPLRRHVARLVDHLIGRIRIPVIGENAILTLEVVIGLGVGKRRQYGKLGQVQVDFQQEIHQPPDPVLGVVVQPQQDRPLHADAVIVIALDALLDIVGSVEHRLVDVPGTGLGCQVEYLGIVLDGMAAPFLLQRDHFAEQLQLPLGVLGQGVVHDEQPVVVDGGHLRNRPGHGPRPELAAAQVGHGAGVAMVAAAPGRMHQVHHLHALVIIEFSLENITPRRADVIERRLIGQIIVDFSQPAVGQVVEEQFHASFGLAEEHRIGMGLGLLGMQHGGDAAEDHRHALGAVMVRDLPAAFDLHGQHHGDAHRIHGIVEIDVFKILVYEIDRHMLGQGRGKHHGTVGRQVELGLTGQFGPAGIDQFDFHGTTFREFSGCASTNVSVRL
ncbi:hypothetical protein DESC_10064 [Desulfosarcina cetonica]|nr:hypothetical protein DESC_10064 [Desulfosarcina cetonica]